MRKVAAKADDVRVSEDKEYLVKLVALRAETNSSRSCTNNTSFQRQSYWQSVKIIPLSVVPQMQA